MAKSWRSSVALATALACASPALANGRYPRAQQLLLDPSDENRLWLRATYGLLTSGDAGRSWSWICEQAAGYTSPEDPAVAVGGDGTFLSGAVEGLFMTTNHGCTWSQVDGFDRHIIDDLATASDRTRVFALANLVEPDGSYELTVWRSDDSGHTFARLESAIASDRFGTTIDVAPSDPSRLYVTAVAGSKPVSADGSPSDPLGRGLFASTDGGQSWVEHPIEGLSKGEQPYIAAVHPTNPDALFVRLKGPEATTGFIESRLLYSSDAGSTFREVFRASAELFGFALANNGNEVFVGLGNSRDELELRPVDPSALGIYRAAVPSFGFERGLRGHVGCLLSSPAGLFACGNSASEHFELALSQDDGSTVSPVLALGHQVDLLVCSGKNTAADTCRDTWPFVCPIVGACSSKPDSGTPIAASGGDGGGGCCGGSTPARGDVKTGTERLDVLSDSPQVLSLAALLAAGLRRARRTTRRRG